MHRGVFGYQPALDGLRAIAVAAVVAYHLGWIDGGFLGVDAFFVLSGYLITSLLLSEHAANGRVALTNFWARRARRLLPAMLAMVAAVVAVVRLGYAPSGLEGLRADVLGTLGYAANWRQVIAGHSYFETFGTPSPLRHVWSLAVEEQFYVVWPLIVAGVLALGRRHGRRALFGLCLAGVIASVVAMAAWYVPGDPSRVYYGTDTRAHLLLLGALLAVSTPVLRVAATRAGQLLGGAALLTSGAAMLFVPATAAWLYHGGTLVHGALVVTVIAAVVARPDARLASALAWRPLRAIGRVSYGVYLWHWPVIVLCTPERTGLDGLRLDLLRLLLTGVATVLSYAVIERPVREWRISVRPVLAGSFATLSAAVIAVPVAVPTLASAHKVFLTSAPSISVLADIAPARATADLATSSAPAVAPPASSAPAALPVVATTPPRPAHVIAVVGDSVAATVAYGLRAAAAGTGVRTVSVAIPGCGVAAGVALRDDDTPYSWSAACTDGVARVHDQLIRDDDPDVVVWLSTWELTDRQEQGEVLHFGTPAHDRALLASLDEAARRLTARNAHLVLVAPAPARASEHGVKDHPVGWYTHYRRLLEREAAAHPGQLSVVDLASIICAGGAPCPERIDGMVVRPDGNHFTEQTAPWLARRLLPLVLDAVNRAATPGAAAPRCSCSPASSLRRS